MRPALLGKVRSCRFLRQRLLVDGLEASRNRRAVVDYSRTNPGLMPDLACSHSLIAKPEMPPFVGYFQIEHAARAVDHPTRLFLWRAL
jgi:hypothetical protein